MWRHPKYYKELRKLRNKLDQAISDSHVIKDSSDRLERAPGPGLKQRDSTGGVPGEADISVTSLKRQASGTKLQAALEAPSNKLQKKI